MFYGHPVERLCTYQYSLISLIPGMSIKLLVTLELFSSYQSGLLQNLDDCGSPPLASRAKTLSRASSLRTSDRKSLMAYLGLPLDIFGKVTNIRFGFSYEINSSCIGLVLPTISSPTTGWSHKRNTRLLMWKYEHYRDSAERYWSSSECKGTRLT